MNRRACSTQSAPSSQDSNPSMGFSASMSTTISARGASLRSWVCMAMFASAAACSDLGWDAGSASGTGPDAPGGFDEGGVPGVPGVPAGTELPAAMPRAARLTPVQWENAVRDLLKLEEHTGFSSELSQDALPAGFLFDNPAETLAVDATQWAGFQRAASRAAAFIVAEPARLARILPEGFDVDPAWVEQFIDDLGGRAHRRPLTSAQRESYRAVFEAGRAAPMDEDPLVSGVRLVVEAMLQSPHFLYRLELSSASTDDEETTSHPLDGFERAARLSFALWGSIPDPGLFEAAAAGHLDTAGVEAHARRMLDDPRAAATLLHFHAQLLEARKLAGVAPSPTFFPDVPADLGALALQENMLFLEDLFGTGGGLTEILTSTRTFVNAGLAQVYGLEGDFPQDAFVPVELDPALRSGIFTHVAFLAQNASSRDPDPIHRGVFLARHIACIPLSAPPANIPPLPPAQEAQTNRARVEAHTEAGPPCADCHQTVINPFGFPYEMYDAVGAVRTSDNGQAVDTSARPLLDEATPVANAVDLARRMADSQVVHECYARHWAEFALGRPHAPEDAPLVARLGVDSLEGAGIKELLVSMVTSRSFLERAVEADDAP